MALVSHQPQGFYVISSSRRLSWSKRLQMKQCLTKCHMIGRTDYLSKQNICLSVGPPCFCVAKLKPLRISGFKGNAQNDDSGTRANRFKVPKTSVRLEEGGEVHNVPLSYASGANEGLETSSTIHRLFKKWLMILRAQPSNQDDDENLGEPPPSGETLQGTQSKARSGVLKVAWSHFLALDATIKVPLLIFVPFYLAVNVKYGVEVSKDLTPLWVFGPLIVALYVMIIRWLCSLYAFTFFQTIKVIKNLPSYCILVFNYVFRGKLKEDIRAYLLQPILNIKNRDYKQLIRNKLKELQVWIMEKYLDFVESVWPYYCRTIRFLKKANLI
ncbi:hypothetical protein TanjilG_00538 [Lupinus angustifolius]|uniref:Uncharacterized protein n=1 Tax=Lupinus angustifolius TaxID=3871 RepID=A0A4P1QXE6_LUPAN|nr:PREDICTED: uncharacterized protein LOC109328553 [Lupinus angustifolius]XP_019417609.1 PREDICTED: uncharacterized protein LOC109328553 [Lupinus angustifolius]XP_019417610.1 PREDICTED: uncharacterized protein LOC109328553 [Lupinus angustifolius]OIV96956.1 hypothetical protein TanjilG_00538 [Lupinus angustifolius]